MDDPKSLTHPTIAIPPIHKLPNELLIRIFTVLCVLQPYSNTLGDPHEIARAYLHIDRADQAPLEVHMLEEYEGTQRITRPSKKVLYRCLKTAVPRKLKELTILLQLGKDISYLDESKYAEYHRSEALVVRPEAHLDDLLLPITTLRLCDFFPTWTSRAYHGLVELCLHIRRNSFHESVFISQPEISSILSHSPKLRVLDLDLQVRDPPAASVSISPIYLGDLEVVRVGSLGRSRSGCLLRSTYARDEGVLPNSVITSFFARSNIKNMWLSRTTYPATLELLSLAPHSRELALSGVDFLHLPHETDDIPHAVRIDTLYLLPSCKIDLGNLRRIALVHQIKSILVHEQCTLTLDGSQVPSPSGTLALPDSLRGVCPNVKRFDSTEPYAWGFPTLYNMGYRVAGLKSNIGPKPVPGRLEVGGPNPTTPESLASGNAPPTIVNSGEIQTIELK
ncbi:hypothetical protein B0J17DRAFT_631826 [Rhizoctonia solani]|nr:hypothetical protein B0J17DRAFT_631826 [Rhizoctonia solani]